MSWALQFDGVNDYVPFTPLLSQNNSSNINWDLEFTAANHGSEAIILGSTSTNAFVILRNTNELEYRVGGGAQKFSVTDVNVSAVYKLELRWSGGVKALTLYENNVFVSTLNISLASILGGDAVYLGRTGSVYRNTLYEDYLTYNDLELSANSRKFDFTASSHAAGTVVVSETINNQDATGVNMPTDGSAWVDLGGGGITLAATLGTINYTSQNATVSLTGSVDVISTLGSINYASQNTTVNLGGLVDIQSTLGLIDYSSNSATIGLTGSVDLIATIGNINYASNNAIVALESQLNINTTLGAIDYTNQNSTVTLSGLIDISATLGTITYNDYNVTVGVGEGQLINNVTGYFADDIYSAGFKPNVITVNFK